MIDKYRRMDEWTGSYQNIWTRTALDCKRKLMKAGVIPVAPLDFVEYLQDGKFSWYDRPAACNAGQSKSSSTCRCFLAK